MFRMLLQEAFRWIVALTTLAGSGALIGTVPLFQEAAPALEFELADVDPPVEELQPEIVIQSDEGGGMSGLAFHPEVMYRGDDECQETYVVRGSLKNHGPKTLEYVEITYTVPSSVTVSLFPTSTTSLDTSKPFRFTAIVSITDTEAWEAGDLPSVMIPLTATGEIDSKIVSTATGAVYIYNACDQEEPEEPVEPEEPEEPDNDIGIAGLVFHPDHLNSGGKCRETYTAQGSLKNHGPGTAVDVTLAYTIPEDYEDVIDVELVNDMADELTTSKPLRFTVNVYIKDTDAWQELGKGESITIQISAQSGGTEVASATMTVRNQCKEPKEKNNPQADALGTKGKPEKPDKPDKPDKSEKNAKPEKPAHPLEGGPPGQNKDKKNK